jgi:peroxiredoxin
MARICDIQMRTLEAKNEELKRLNIIALGISVDSQPCKKEWADYMKITKTDLLADFWPHGDIAKKYDIFIEKAGISGRANFLIDEEGKIIFIKIYAIPEVPDIEEIIRFAMK